MVAGVIPTGTLLYHLTSVHEIPSGPEWVAMDPEHSYLFCVTQGSCWHLTLVVTHPLKVLYFDGNSASKLLGGSMDSQDLIAWGKIDTKRVFDEYDRLADLCAWAKDRDIHGFVRQVRLVLSIYDF